MAIIGNQYGDGYLQQQLGIGTLGNYVTLSNTSSSNVATTYLEYLSSPGLTQPEPAPAAKASARDDAFAWLRARVAEVCWSDQ